MSEFKYGDRVRYKVNGRGGIIRNRAAGVMVDLDNGESHLVAPDGEIRPCDLELAGGVVL